MTATRYGLTTLEQAREQFLAVRIVTGPPVQRIELEGELDLATVQLLTDTVACIAETTADHVEVSLRGLRFMGACGVHALLAASDMFSAKGKLFTVTAACPIVRRVLDVTGTAHVLKLA